MITIVDYKAGNLTSVKRAFDHLGIPNQISADPQVIRQAEQIVFPESVTPARPCGCSKSAGWILP